jgi:hypothetical protein
LAAKKEKDKMNKAVMSDCALGNAQWTLLLHAYLGYRVFWKSGPFE